MRQSRSARSDPTIIMRTRDKVVVVLIVASLILGGLIFVAFQDNEVEANYSRWLFTTNLQHLFLPRQNSYPMSCRPARYSTAV